MKPGFCLAARSSRYAVILILLAFCMLVDACGQKLHPSSTAYSSQSPTWTIVPIATTSLPFTVTGTPTTRSTTIAQTSTVIQPSSVILSPTKTLKPTRTVSPTPQATPTRSIFDFPAPVSGSVVRQQCLTLQDDLPDGQNMKGTVVLGTEKLDRLGIYGEAYLIDMQNGTTHLAFKTQFKGDFVPSIYRISPDRKWFFYFETLADGKGSQLHISAIDGREMPVAYWDLAWGDSAEWLDDRRLIVWPPSDWINGIYIILNPFTGEWQKQVADAHVVRNSSITYPMIHYNPNLKQAIYQSGDSIYILWDIPSNQEIWIKRGANFYVPPRWSPDGTQFAMVITQSDFRQSDIFVVTPDGRETQLTHLAEAYPSISEIYIEDMEWSPDGRYIAFTVFGRNDVVEFKGPTLMVFDVATRQITDYCVVVSEYSGGYLVWSPDSKQVVVASPIDYLEYIETAPKGVKPHVRVVWLDIEKGVAAQIAEDMAPMGWMLSP
jgi:hypothetical protein